MAKTKADKSAREQAEAHPLGPWGGFCVGVPRMHPDSVVGGMMINFGTVEFMTIMLLRLLLPAGQERSKLTKRPLRPRIDAIVTLLEASDLLESPDCAAAVDALKCLRSVAKVRNMIAHDPFLRVGGKWIWAQVSDADDDLNRVRGVTIEMIAEANEYAAIHGVVLEGLLRPHISKALGMPENSARKKWPPPEAATKVSGAKPMRDKKAAPAPRKSPRKK